ncbi:MAG: CoA-binding protein [candidate division SR1 bacterium]|nr:CoA-binding protein [candidate division SR1 bacterium]
MIDKNLTYAVVGASNDENKYGHKVFLDLLQNGFHVIAINPNEKEILGEKVYATLTDFGKEIDVVIFVVPPKVTEMVLEEVLQLKIFQVRMQPGSESEDAISFCKENNITCTHDACIMIQRQTEEKNNTSQ